MKNPFDIIFMKKALKAAKTREDKNLPNPAVACLVVKKDKIISKAVHMGCGKPHAERAALEKAGREAAGSTLYVNLEPCCHYGRTPPCTEIIIKSKVKKVVYALQDPNELVCGKGCEELKKAGIEVLSGVCAEEAFEMNEKYFVARLYKRPFISLKAASTADGFVRDRNGVSKWITGNAARAFGRKLRSAHSAVAVGTNTVIEDNPNLTSGQKKHKEPLRVILDRQGRIPRESNVFKDENYVLFSSVKKGMPRTEILEGKKFSFPEILDMLYGKYSVFSLLVEGGPSLLSYLYNSNLFDRIYHFTSPFFLGEGLKMIDGKFTLEKHPLLIRKKVLSIEEDLLSVYSNSERKIKIGDSGCLQV